MIVPHHLIAAQKESQRQGEQENGRGAAQEFRFEASFQAEDAQDRFRRSVPQFGQTVPKLPAARGQPVNQRANDCQGEQEAAQLGVERQVEQVEGERELRTRDRARLWPRRAGRASRCSAPRSSYRTSRRRRNSSTPVAQRGYFGVGCDFPAAKRRANFIPRAWAINRTAKARRVATVTGARPYPSMSSQVSDLAHFLPPLVFDDIAGDRTCAEQKSQQHDRQPDLPPGALAAWTEVSNRRCSMPGVYQLFRLLSQ